MIGLTRLEVYNSIYNSTEENNKFELYKLPDEKAGSVSYTKVRDEIERVMDNSEITAVDLQGDILGPIFIEEYRKQVTKTLKDDKYMLILAMCVDFIFQKFESFLRTEGELNEDDFKLVLDEYNSSFTTNELQPGIHNFKHLSETFFNIIQLEYQTSSSEIVVEIDDYTRKIKLVVRPGIIAIRFDKNSFFRTILGFFQDRIITTIMNTLVRKL